MRRGKADRQRRVAIFDAFVFCLLALVYFCFSLFPSATSVCVCLLFLNVKFLSRCRNISFFKQ